MKVIHKNFRLFDFHIFDKKEEKEEKKETETETETINEIFDPDTESYQSNKQKPISKSAPVFMIQMFGINEKGETCSIIVDDYEPFFFIKVPKTWRTTDADALLTYLRERAGYFHKTSIISATLENYQKLYGFTGGEKDQFVRIQFKNVSAMNKVKGLWVEYVENVRKPKKVIFQKINLELYESTIPPLLRYFHIHNISPSGWVSINILLKTSSTESGFRPCSPKTTTCNYEYIGHSKYVIPLPQKETIVPYKICSFDIEASSSHGDFPVPKKTYKRLATNMVDVFTKHLSLSKLSKEQGTKLFEKMILTAFGYSKFDDIDLVYPKDNTKPTFDELKTIIQTYIQTPVECIQKNETLFSLDKLFSKKGILEKEEAVEPEGSDDESIEESCLGEDENEGDEEEEKEEDVSVKVNAKSRTKKPTINPITIIDILLKTDVSREEKIIRLNEGLTPCDSNPFQFPPLKGDTTTFIGSTFIKYGEPEPYFNHCLVLGTSEPVAGAMIETVKTESDLLTQWSALIQRENPDVIIGYNIFGFDYQFMFHRAQENDCEEEFLKLSRIKGHIGATKDANDEYHLYTTKIMLASGEYELHYPKMIGRLQIDLLGYFRKNEILPSYKLDDVSGHFIGDSITHIITDTEGTHLYTDNIKGLHINDFIHIQITEFTTNYVEDGRKFCVRDIQLGVVYQNKSYQKILIDPLQKPLTNIKDISWGLAKDDVSPQDIFRLTRGSSQDRSIVAKYCIQDCNIVHHLMIKADILVGFIEMATICSVPMSFLVLRGQGIKLTSFVAKKCREKQTLMPDLEKLAYDDGYEGAIVLPPKCSMYIDNPVACLDYSSLYPSNMISQNLSHDSKVWTREYDLEGRLIKETGVKSADGTFTYDNLAGYEYIDIPFDTYRYVRTNPTAKAKKVISGKKVCRWAQFPNEKRAILPSILEELLKARKHTKNLAKKETDEFMSNILDKRQLAYKVTANSLYGQCGSRTSTFYEKDIAAATTSTGRMMITYAKRMIEEVYGDAVCQSKQGTVLTKAEYIYGDSVANYTPIYIRSNGEELEIMTIESLATKYGGGIWVNRDDKEFCELSHLSIDSWTDQGWTKLHRVIRHRLAPHKKMIRILTHTGLVDATDDHSLLLVNGTPISPKDLLLGTSLLHNKLPFTEKNNNTITIEEAQIMGFFMKDGDCVYDNSQYVKKSSWMLNNASMELIKKYKEMCSKIYPNFEWIIKPIFGRPITYKITPKCSINDESIHNFVIKYRSMMYTDNTKIIPNEIFNSNKEIRKAFWDGLYDASGDKGTSGYVIIDQKEQISASHIYYLARSLDWKPYINTINDKPNVYRISTIVNYERRYSLLIKQMVEIPYPVNEYVYDLTTENHHFSAGIGEMVVHNTDSVFFTFHLEDPTTHKKILGSSALEITIEIAQEVAKLCTRFLKTPMELSYEKTMMPFILLSKKRYVGMLYETDPKKGKLKVMGLPLKRRDACDYLKDVYGGCLNIFMGKNHDLVNGLSITQQSIAFLDSALKDLIEGKVPMEKLMITKALRSDYKNPLSIGHNVLANRIGERDAGSKPKPGDRVKFLFVNHSNKKALIGDRIETPEFIIQKNLQIDYMYYITNQLMKPLQQLFGLNVERIWVERNQQTDVKRFQQDMATLWKQCGENQEEFSKKKEKVASKHIKILLFDKFLTQIFNKKNGIQTMDKFFQNKKV